jgi:hypothetical protein
VFDLGLRLVGRGGVEPPTFHFSGRSFVQVRGFLDVRVQPVCNIRERWVTAQRVRQKPSSTTSSRRSRVVGGLSEQIEGGSCHRGSGDGEPRGTEVVAGPGLELDARSARLEQGFEDRWPAAETY